MPWLKVLLNSGEEIFLPVLDGVVVGRGRECDLLINSSFPEWDTVSRQHARFSIRGGRWVIHDLGSTNGTFVNGFRTGTNFLRHGDTIGLGGLVMVFLERVEEDDLPVDSVPRRGRERAAGWKFPDSGGWCQLLCTGICGAAARIPGKVTRRQAILRGSSGGLLP